MGWASGSALFGDVITSVVEEVEDPNIRCRLFYILIQNFKDFDCDTLDECVGQDPSFDKAWKELHEDLEMDIEEPENTDWYESGLAELQLDISKTGKISLESAKKVYSFLSDIGIIDYDIEKDAILARYGD